MSERERERERETVIMETASVPALLFVVAAPWQGGCLNNGPTGQLSVSLSLLALASPRLPRAASPP